MIKFAQVEYLYTLTLIPALVLLFFWARYRYRRALEKFGALQLLKRLMPAAAHYKRSLKFTLVVIAFGFLLVGLANPQIGSKLEEVKREGVDIVICLDVSLSMKAEDIKPNRLERAKRLIVQLLNEFQNDRVGLVIYAVQSFLQLPLTADYSAVRLLLGTIDTDAIPVQGTAIGSAIRLAMKSFVEGEKKHKVILLISDGENHEDDVIAAAEEAFKDGIVVHTIGIGTPQGAPIPLYQNPPSRGLVGFKKDRNGEVVITKLDESALRQIAEAGGGKYINASNPQQELDIIFKEVQAMEKKEIGTKVFTEYEDRFQYLLFVAFVLLALECFVSERRNPLFERIKTFITHPSQTTEYYSEREIVK